ncbi:myo-inositol transporter [Aspergillus nanangensis]|uniref:Myo-inositol transporter n=1 Tax=Aspergillus nanangensis TaxID=2582783 RepID=A0AAD4GQB3_ASPNN|nr:myo-inositol transporter [Aspergillus nanangensis]
MSHEHSLQIALQAIHLASITTKTLLLQNTDKGSTAKDDDSPVTIADFASQAILISILRHHFPSDQFVGEESASVLRSDHILAQRVWDLITASLQQQLLQPPLSSSSSSNDEATATTTTLGLPTSLPEMLEAIDLGEKPPPHQSPTQRTWFLDPIDGTASYIQNSQYAVSIALVTNGEQQVGVVGFPNLPYIPSTSSSPSSPIVEETTIDPTGFGTLLSAIKGQGTYKRQMTHSGLSPPTKIQIQIQTPTPTTGNNNPYRFTDSMSSPYIEPRKHIAVRQRLGVADAPVLDLWAMQVKYAALALGACSAMIRIPRDREFRPCTWDHAGGMLVYEEAGGKITDLYGRRFDYASGRRLSKNLGLVAALPQVHEDLLRVVREVFEEE